VLAAQVHHRGERLSQLVLRHEGGVVPTDVDPQPVEQHPVELGPVGGVGAFVQLIWVVEVVKYLPDVAVPCFQLLYGLVETRLQPGTFVADGAQLLGDLLLWEV
jgi:hypothetical protein